MNIQAREITIIQPGLADGGGCGSGWRVSETMENTRRWSGFVCPECRFVFRVPRDHDGRGVVCPGCRRVLKIPSPHDQTQDLVIPLPATPETEAGSKRKKRRRKSRRTDAHDWDSAGGKTKHTSSHRDRRQMRWMLIGGSGFLALCVVAVFMAMRKSNGKTPPPLPVAGTPATPVIQEPVFSEAAFLAEAEPLAKRFLDAKTIDDLLPLVRHPEITGPRLRALHPDGTLQPAGMSAFNINAELVPAGSGHTVRVRTGEYAEKTMAFFPTPAGVRVDWESWAGWSEMPWGEFIQTRPTGAKLFRGMLGPVDYYNFDFTDDRKWRSYRLISPDGEHSLYAYVELGSVLDERLRPSPDQKQIPLTLSLRYPPDATSPNQVLVEKWHADGWVLENETEP